MGFLAAIGFAGAAAGGAEDDGGAAAGFGAKGPEEPLVGLFPPGAFCAQTGAAIARAAAMATPVKRCFMLLVLYGSSGFDTTATACFSCGRPCGPWWETTLPLLR